MRILSVGIVRARDDSCNNTVNRFYVVYAGRKLTRRSRLRPIQGTDNARFAQEKVNLPKSVFWIWHRWMTAVQHWDEPNLG